MLPQGYKILIDHYPNRPIPRSTEEALEAQQEHVQARQEQERARKAQLPASKPKKERKGLTKRQERELEILRQELGQGT
jgi:RNA processing factor Prp31